MPLWRNVRGFEGFYLISDEGDVYSLPRIVQSGKKILRRNGKYLKPGMRGKGDTRYKFVVLSDGARKKQCSVHRLVAEAFIANPTCLPEVNHKDENPLNNNVENLEWCDRQYNIEYSKNKSVSQFRKDGTKVADYKSITYASQRTGIKRMCIENNLHGFSMTAGGYVWKFN